MNTILQAASREIVEYFLESSWMHASRAMRPGIDRDLPYTLNFTGESQAPAGGSEQLIPGYRFHNVINQSDDVIRARLKHPAPLREWTKWASTRTGSWVYITETPNSLAEMQPVPVTKDAVGVLHSFGQ